jgi:adenylylsulfate kinase-like enzyme
LTTSPGSTIWLTGLSGAGKSTIARALETAPHERQCHVEVLDGDEVRENLSKGLLAPRTGNGLSTGEGDHGAGEGA